MPFSGSWLGVSQPKPFVKPFADNSGISKKREVDL